MKNSSHCVFGKKVESNLLLDLKHARSFTRIEEWSYLVELLGKEFLILSITNLCMTQQRIA